MTGPVNKHCHTEEVILPFTAHKVKDKKDVYACLFKSILHFPSLPKEELTSGTPGNRTTTLPMQLRQKR